MPMITRVEYTRKAMQEVKKNYFGSSLRNMLSFFVEEEHLTEDDIKELFNQLKEA